MSDKLLDLISEAKDSNKTYAVFKNWRTPPDIKIISELHANNKERYARTSIIGKYDEKEIDSFLNECLSVYDIPEYAFYVIKGSAGHGHDTHKDPYDIIHWQCSGSTKWKIGKKEIGKLWEAGQAKNEKDGFTKWKVSWLKEPDTFILEPGDIMWFRGDAGTNVGAWHSTLNLSDKYSIVFDAGKEEFPEY